MEMRPVLFIVALFSQSLFAAVNQEAQFNDHLNWAQSAQQSTTSRAQGKLSIEDLCADAACVQQAKNPKESRYGDADIGSKTTGEFYSNDQAKAIQSSFDKGRPNVKNDPAYEFALLGQENAYEITHGISNAYVDCEGGTQCLVEHAPRKCTTGTGNIVPCNKVPVPYVEIADTFYACPEGWTLDGVTCHGIVTECRYNRTYIGGNYSDLVFGIKHPGGSCGGTGKFIFTYYWDGKVVKPQDGFTMRSLKREDQGASSNCPGVTQEYEICGPAPVTEPAFLACPTGFSLSGAQCVKNVIQWKSECTMTKDCNVISQTCIEGKETRLINGVEETLECWKYVENVQCDIEDTCGTLPSSCETVDRQCSFKQNDVCLEIQSTKSCPFETCSTTQLQCGEVTFCLDGECYTPMPKPSDDFAKSASALKGVVEAGKDFGEPPTMFAGKGMKCTNASFGWNNCCKSGGWGNDIGLSSCDAEEKGLGQAREKKLAISLGDYCAERVLGVCTRRKETYCVYDSKLSRIIQEQGTKGQLNLNFGSAQDPICPPITPEQLQGIDFSKIDFSDFYEDLHEGMTPPDMGEIKDRIQSAFEDF